MTTLYDTIYDMDMGYDVDDFIAPNVYLDVNNWLW